MQGRLVERTEDAEGIVLGTVLGCALTRHMPESESFVFRRNSLESLEEST
jgi:hypothetical protein